MTDLSATGGVAGPGRIGRVAIGDLLTRAARRYPDRVALTDGARRATFAEIDRDANRFANALLARGLKPGDKAATICNNSIDMVKGLFGLHRAGLVWTPINTLLAPADMDYILDHAGVRFAHAPQHNLMRLRILFDPQGRILGGQPRQPDRQLVLVGLGVCLDGNRQQRFRHGPRFEHQRLGLV